MRSDGDPGDPTVLLIMGLGLQLVWWRDDFVAELVSRGFRVVRFDNRDVGESQPFRGPTPSAWQFLRRRAPVTYTLEDMADDAAGLLDGPAHVVGVSMGALIAQEVAIRHPDRVASLTSIMGRPGDGRSGRVARTKQHEFLRPGSAQPDRAAEQLVETFRRIGSTHRTPEDDEDVRVAFRRSLRRERGNGSGSGRQLAAILTERDRTPDLRRLEVPTLVVHGARDKVILPSGGRATAAAIPGAELLELDDMGHDLARWTWPAVLDGIARTAARGERP